MFSRTVINNTLLITFLIWNSLYIYGLDKGIGVFGGLFQVTSFTQTVNIFILIITGLILTLNGFFPRKLYRSDVLSIQNLFNFKLIYDKTLISNKTGKQFSIIEYSLIIVFILCGALFLVSTNDLISVFLSIELQSYGLYIISSIYRDSESSTASGLTYFLLGGLSSCFILLGSALLYANSGNTSIENIYVITSISEITTSSFWYQPYYLHFSLIIFSVGFLFKVSAAPFHFWSPDVYDGIPTIVTTYVAIVAKISIFAFLLELVYYTQQEIFDFTWKTVLLLSSLLSLIIGSVLGLTQFRIKRLYAYSTINHVGFILLALSISTTESVQSYVFYIFQYSLANLNTFLILISMGYSLFIYANNINSSKTIKGGGKEKDNSPIQLVNEMKGYFYINPYMAISLVITLFSFAGIPPMIGFFAKQMVLSAALDSGYIFLALIAILTSVISAAYYLNVIKEMFFFKSEYIKNPSINNIKTHLTKFRGWFNPLTYNKAVFGYKEIKSENIVLTSALTSIISIITLIITMFISSTELPLGIALTISLALFNV